LIIVYDDFYNSILDLRDWKVAKGLGVEVTKTSEIPDGGDGLDDADILDYIQGEYEDWGISYVLLVGDVEHIPTHYYPGLWTPVTPSDHYYSDLADLPEHSESYFSEVFVGRVSIKNSPELDVIVDKIIGYEQAPYVPRTGWYERAMMWHLNSISTVNAAAGYIRDMLMFNGYTDVDMFNASQSAPPPDTSEDVNAAINDGRHLATYMGHGWYTEWINIPFTNADVLDLTNGRKLPLITSIACYSGGFDYVPSDCIGEVWLKGDITKFPEVNGGIGYFGPSRPSSRGYAEKIMEGVYTGIFDDGLINFAKATNRGKIYMYNHCGDPAKTKEKHFELFNNLGDPSLLLVPPIPRVYDGIASTEINTPAEIALKAGDNGLPIPPGALTYIVTSLPTHGTLSEPGIGGISSVPYSLADNGNKVIYMPDTYYLGPDSFEFKANDGGTPPNGGDSDEATITVNVFEIVNWWKLDETSGQMAEDSVGNSNGTLNNFPFDDSQWVEGKRDGGLEFDGEDDYVELGTLEALKGDSVTISAWTKPYDASAYYSPLVMQSDYVDGDGLGYNLCLASGEPYFLLDDTATEWTGDEISSNEWHHLAGTYDNERLRMYCDGVLKSFAWYGGKSGCETRAYIGYNRDWLNQNDCYFNGIIDDVQVYNGAMDEDEIWDKMFYGTSKFSVLDSSGVRVAWFDDLGNLFLKGTLTEDTTPQATGNDEFRVQDSDGNDVAIIDMTNGNIYLDGSVQATWAEPSAESDDFIIKDSSGAAVAYIDDSGELYLKGNVYEAEP